jgi:hypothetical protein
MPPPPHEPHVLIEPGIEQITHDRIARLHVNLGAAPLEAERVLRPYNTPQEIHEALLDRNRLRRTLPVGLRKFGEEVLMGAGVVLGSYHYPVNYHYDERTEALALRSADTHPQLASLRTYVHQLILHAGYELPAELAA